MADPCTKVLPPNGYAPCTREAGHEGPCAHPLASKPEPPLEPWHYYESHITIDPVFDQKLEDFKAFCAGEKFRVADLLLKKSKDGAAETHVGDSFCTSRGEDYQELENRTFSLLEVLQDHGYKIRRYKIESTLLDSRYNDSKYRLG